ncbi:LLM class flavin-dependent oxidoreductase [Prauserella halophila]|uniref:LLM class flavin-dependent oxidoreductase n=1 Tax=Prauserella halophila TaxID=185641 RepID=A0ABN1WIM2_9PSEU|nr:LLM class flavin-dependent oxidoreductase [Prauserella halophila]MCP2238189.1 Flavin-dependent oxidoreductase, luciferase family (includes alkanesulfonate monooxygenase SsuD and methylene tetrahydromethanopterin reductase) [Prauserella halophila]
MSVTTPHYGIFSLSNVPPWNTHNEVVHKAVEQIKHADRLGFEEAWVAEHNGRRYGIVASAQLLLAAAAPATKRIRLGSGVSRLPMHHPLRLAEDYAYVDQLSDGRLNFGIGKAYDKLEFQAYGIPEDERDERYEEAFDIIMRAWREGKVRYRGKHYQVPGEGEVADEIELFPEVVQKPTPPVFVMVSASEDSLRLAARRGFSFVLGQRPTREDVRRLVEVYREEAREAGYSFDSIDENIARASQLKAIHVAEDREQAKEEYREGYMWYVNLLANRAKVGLGIDELSFDEYIERKTLLLGSADDVAEELASFHSHTGLGGLVAWFDAGSQPQDQVLRSMTMFAEKVRPQL